MKAKQTAKKALALCLATAMTMGMVATTKPTEVMASAVGDANDGVTFTKGDKFYLGTYPQDSLGVVGNVVQPPGTENVDWVKAPDVHNDDKQTYFDIQPIAWQVLGDTQAQPLVITEKNIDGQPYNDTYGDITWEDSKIRENLNATFYANAFTAIEENVSTETTVINADNPYTGTDGGEDTNDKLFLLSLAEAENQEYFADDSSRIAKNTDFAASRDDDMYAGGQADYWWLRSPGSDDHRAAYVLAAGHVYDNGYFVNFDLAVRPAFKLNPSSVIFSSEIVVAGGSPQAGQIVADDVNYVAGEAGTQNFKLTILNTLLDANLTNVKHGTEDITTQPTITVESGQDITLTGQGAALAGANLSDYSINYKIVDSSRKIVGYGEGVTAGSVTGTDQPITIPAKKLDGTSLAEGDYTTYVWLQDNKATNSHEGSTPLYFNMRVENVPPTVVSTTPTGNTVAITETSATITFNEAMSTTTANLGTLAINGTTITPTATATSPTWSTDGKTIAYDFSSDLNLVYGQTYSVSISGFKDLAENVMTADANRSFTVVADPHLGAPDVTSFSPANGATSAAANTDLTITFDEPVAIDSGSIKIYKENNPTAVYEITSPSALGMVSPTSGFNTTYTINPTADLEEGTTYYVTIDGTFFKDSARGHFAGFSNDITWSFKTVEPQVKVDYSANGGGNVSAIYSGSPFASGNTVTSGSSLTFAATAKSEYTFAGWEVNGVQMGSANPLLIPITEDTTVVANFVLNAPTLPTIPVPTPTPVPTTKPTPTPKPTPTSGVNDDDDDDDDNDDDYSTMKLNPTTAPITNPMATNATATNPTQYTNPPLMMGDPDGNFRPQDTLTRAEVAQVLYNTMFNGKLAEDAPFGDVDQDAWYANAINFAYAKGYMVGYPEGTFDPSAPITRAEIMVVFDNVMGYGKEETQMFTDTADHWANDQINAAASAMGLEGYPDGSFKPDDNITRGDFAIMLAKATERVEYAEDFVPKDVNPSDYYYEYVTAVTNYSK